MYSAVMASLDLPMYQVKSITSTNTEGWPYCWWRRSRLRWICCIVRSQEWLLQGRSLSLPSSTPELQSELKQNCVQESNWVKADVATIEIIKIFFAFLDEGLDYFWSFLRWKIRKTSSVTFAICRQWQPCRHDLVHIEFWSKSRGSVSVLNDDIDIR